MKNTRVKGAGSTVLTADHLRLRAKGEDLLLDASGGVSAKRGVELATELCAVLAAANQQQLGELLEQFADVVVAPREEKLKAGLIKLLMDQSELEEIDNEQLEAWRAEVFAAATLSRQRGTFTRADVLASCPPPTAIHELGLFADLDLHIFVYF